jgi:hypothetical protein
VSDFVPKLAASPVNLVSLPFTTSPLAALPEAATLSVEAVPSPEISVFDNVIAPVLPATVVTALLGGAAQTPSPLR